jgi:hypothetical protein
VLRSIPNLSEKITAAMPKLLPKTSRKRNALRTPAQKRQFESAQRNGTVVKDPLPDRPAWAKFLTDREYLFIREYLVDFKAGKAALRAGIGNNPESAAAMASSLRRMPHVAQAIDAAIAGSEGGSVRTRLVEELSVMALHNPKDYLLKKNRAELETLPEEAFLSIRKVKEVRGKNPSFEVEGVDKLGAIKLLGSATGMFKDEKANTNVAVQVVFQNTDSGLT